MIHSTSSREAISISPNKQLASIRTFQERRNNKSINRLISRYFFPACCEEVEVSNTIIILSQGTGGNPSPSSSARVPGLRASYTLCRRIALQEPTIRYPHSKQASTLGPRVSRPKYHRDLALLSFQSSINRHNSATGSQSQSQSQMASRSFKPASYLASAPSRSPRQRPAFTRTSSGSSTLSTASEDSFTSTLRGLCANDGKQKENDDPGKAKL